MNIIMQNLVERLRSLVGLNGWDYCIYWKLSEDERFLEWLGCCCGGTESNKNGGEEHLFPVSSVVSCRDTTYPHPRTKPCDLLSQLSTSIPIDNSGIYTQTLLTNQPSWVNYSNSLDSSILDETMGTQVLISAPGGLIELFVTKQVAEDHQVIDFVKSQCIEAVNHSMSFNIDVNSMSNMQQNPLLGDENEGNNSRNTHFHPSDVMTMDHRIGLCSSPLNFMQQFNYNQLNRMKSDAFSEEYQGSFFHDKQTNPEDEHDNTYQKSLMTTDSQYMESLEAKEKQEEDKELLKHVVARSDSMSDCSEQNEEEEDGKYRRRNGKGNQSKNLMAERKRRKKLNDRLYKLRSLVPRISKLDRASILGDAIEYVKDLQKQVKELQDELEENADTESNCINGNNDNNNNQYVGVGELCPNSEPIKGQSGLHVGTSGNGYVYKQKEDAALIEKQTQQMEPQVEVALIDGNEYFVKVFCEHRPGGFVKLMESLNTIGMDVVHATVTSHKGLVSNVFEVEKKDNETVEAEDVRESLLELTRNRYRGWSHEVTPTSENAVGRDQHQIPSFSHHFHT
ncbi:transcription factor ABORTED MICROSPORES [Vigna umbellata]|uniref:transcription factor ABORTED MICROSPORES n=1 Tax=Vigna umbellata TaxID=87088 RepID=UPI001F5EB764|nr:transcription factor ABORTED MICROSPORES [Vigna umbellata]XP_047180574.1 transcription factor ABORTED MICROSPORES [Vigna umbellata]XP_047180575.1 transcription factor ABORTED MICROSPORES [Vigna umbellata]XP_047180576.1 transcription factor ABORTED MICROSPORES [Vigna umbellata]XP_047180577.1 transcription factor ABORTED MICROSPORES [Vigna umbellata]